MKPRLVDKGFDRLDQVATLVVQIPRYKQLAAETGLAHNYVKNVMSRLVRLRRSGIDVPRETILRSLGNEKEFDNLLAQGRKR